MNQEKALVHNMTEGPLLKQLVVFSIPIILGNILQACYTIVDMVIVGNFVGSDGLSAVGIGGILTGLLMMCGMGMAFGGQILLSQQVGAGMMERVNRTIGTFMSLGAFFGILSGVLGAAFCGPLLSLLNTPAPVLDETRSYFLTCCGGILFIYGYDCIGAILRGLGESKLPTVFIAIAAVMNILLDLLLVGAAHMGVAGAALATVSAQGVSFVVSLIYLSRHRDRFGFDFKLRSFLPERVAAMHIMKLSLPIIIFGLMMSISSIFINSNVNSYGVAASAVDGIGNKLIMVVNSITMGIYTGAGVIVGQCFGAGKQDRIRSCYRLSTALSVAIWAVTTVILLLFPNAVFRIFSSDGEVLSMARNYLLVASIGYLGMALATAPFALFEGVGNTNLEMVSGIVENLVVRILLGVILQRYLGLYGYWLATSISCFTTPVFGTVYYYSGLWTKRSFTMEH